MPTDSGTVQHDPNAVPSFLEPCDLTVIVFGGRNEIQVHSTRNSADALNKAKEIFKQISEETHFVYGSYQGTSKNLGVHLVVDTAAMGLYTSFALNLLGEQITKRLVEAGLKVNFRPMPL